MPQADAPVRRRRDARGQVEVPHRSLFHHETPGSSLTLTRAPREPTDTPARLEPTRIEPLRGVTVNGPTRLRARSGIAHPPDRVPVAVDVPLVEVLRQEALLELDEQPLERRLFARLEIRR